MKIEKQFIPLILSGKKKYEFRQDTDKEGIYKIEDKYFMLRWIQTGHIGSYQNFDDCSVWYTVEADVNKVYHITKAEYDWFNENEDYIANEITIYEWIPLEFKKLEIVEGKE